MGYQTIGIEGAVTSWTGTVNTALLAAIKSHSARITIDGGTGDRTPFAPTNSTAQYGGGLRSWSGTITARLGSTPLVGYNGLVTFSSGDVLHVQKWNMAIAAGELDATALGSTATNAGWKSFRPGHLNWSGGYEGLVDSGTATVLPFSPDTAPASATFQLLTSNTLAGTILYSQQGIEIPVGDLNRKSYSFVGSSTLTAAGSANLFAAGTVPTPEWDTSGTDGVADTSLVLAAASGRTFTGAAFWTSINVAVDPKAYTVVTVNFRGSGALTPA